MGIGPSTKETSLHHFRDPLVDIVGSDSGIDLMGVLLFGTSDDNWRSLEIANALQLWQKV